MNLRSTTWPVTASWVSMAVERAFTSTVCDSAVTLKIRFAVAFSLTFNRTSFSTVLPKPFISAVTEYNPGGTEANRYRPSLLEVVVN